MAIVKKMIQFSITDSRKTITDTRKGFSVHKNTAFGPFGTSDFVEEGLTLKIGIFAMSHTELPT